MYPLTVLSSRVAVAPYLRFIEEAKKLTILVLQNHLRSSAIRFSLATCKARAKCFVT
jgi:hypothetical protein